MENGCDAGKFGLWERTKNSAGYLWPKLVGQGCSMYDYFDDWRVCGFVLFAVVVAVSIGPNFCLIQKREEGLIWAILHDMVYF